MKPVQRYKSKRRYLRAFRTRFSIFPIMNARARTDRRRNERTGESLFRKPLTSTVSKARFILCSSSVVFDGN